MKLTAGLASPSVRTRIKSVYLVVFVLSISTTEDVDLTIVRDGRMAVARRWTRTLGLYSRPRHAVVVESSGERA